MDQDGAEQVAEWWKRTPEGRAAERRTNWLEHPRLLHYSAKRVTGNRFGEAWRWALERDRERPVGRLLSLGCGGGGLERRVAKLRWAREIEGIDVSTGAVEQAEEATRAAGLGDQIEYRVADLDSVTLDKNSYDVVVAQMSVHHVAELEHLFDQVGRSLRPGGVFVLNEYVGPTRWQLQASRFWALLPQPSTKLRIASASNSSFTL